ncbi:gliding motility-associated ABC transporter substrate-binding protein GldG [Seonamhaeicola sediminis]|uniref:Gliding motility-associated ABC transporter substrate-binding protein GldG n=1 Tax=Seonamhaeicola sediminis TaxID=2528206 RepID=A0A562YCC9_9FLAO|nr:gliding motility-associated ABC transporter substrate-binding protein GldG [Seonamhaeicola sediminis]TWO31731.1 gliding motility-associated ABC transporter substrate-binding protein GldG [Seonamhaeicola sediminis]
MKKKIKHIAITVIVLIAINVIGNTLFKRFDLTEDKRYTLSESAVAIIKNIDSPIVIDVFLDGDDFPSEFRRLQTETKQLLEEFSNINDNIVFNFINPLENETTREQNINQLINRGLAPMQLSVSESGKSSKAIIFPWALASFNEQTVTIPLIKNKIGASQQELVSNSVQHLEYAFADGFNKLTKPKQRKIAILKGNQQLDDIYIADFVKKLGEYYFIAPFTLDSVTTNAQKTLNDLKAFDLIISAKPTQAFSEREKLVLDQFTMNGGKSLWLLDAVSIEKDSLYNNAGKNYAVSRDLNLTDFFFKYGVRINPSIVADLYSAPIMLATGKDNDTRLMRLRWPYSPLAKGNTNHPITNNLNLVKFDFANPIDTLKNSIEKTVLLKSSELSKLEGVPREISLELATQEPETVLYNKGSQILAVLLEGEFNSAYKNLIKPLKLATIKDQSSFTKMIVIADGDVIKNNVDRNGPTNLAFDRSSNQEVGNKEFLLNAVNYLLDDDGLINIRSKEIAVAFLDQQKIANEKTKWQLINTTLPLVLLTLFGFVFNFIRKKKYAS